MPSFKLLLLSTVVLSAGILLRLSAPVFADFAVYEVPSIYNGVVSWLRPPYLYLVINCIIITIVASSKLHSVSDKDVQVSPPLQPLETTFLDINDQQQSDACNDAVVNGGDSDLKVLEFEEYEENVEPPELQPEDYYQEDPASNKENEMVITNPTWKNDEGSVIDNKFPFSARFGHRKSLKPSPEGSKAVLRVSKSKKQDTLESTWKAITEGRSMPLNRHLRKNETWERTSSPKITMSKVETFNGRTNNASSSPLMTPSPGSGKLKKEPSLCEDELNRRVEAFIKKFNDEMRLQRQESLNQYVQMVKQGS